MQQEIDKREKRLAYKRAYYQAHKVEIAAKDKARAASNKKQIAERMKAWREKNLDRIQARERAYTENNRALIKERHEANAASTAFKRARDRAKKKNIDFNIDLVEIKRIVDRGYCELTGIAFHKKFGSVENRAFYYPSIDRINSKLGYIKGNVRVVLSGVNIMMNAWGPDKIIEIANALNSYSVKAG